MIDYPVGDLAELLQVLRDDDCTVVGGPEESVYGRFGWAMDPEGNKVKLWEPPADK